jgi:hypothetical protein
MFRRLLGAVGLSIAADTAVAEPRYAPYQNDATNEIYNRLFCDDPASYKPKPGQSPIAWQATLFSEPVDRSALLALANDSSQEGRVRYLAYVERVLWEN